MADDPLTQAVLALQAPEAQAFLGTLAGPESGGRYNVRFDASPTGATFDPDAGHPRVPVVIPQGWPMAGSTSDAAGAYQMLGSTWNGSLKRLGLPSDTPFSPYFQQLGAWNNAEAAYGPSLLADLQAGKVDQVMAKMRSSRQWDTASPQAYAGNLARLSQTASAGGNMADVSGMSDTDLLNAFVKGTLGAPASAPSPSPAPVAASPVSGIDALAAAGGNKLATGAPAASSGLDALAAVGNPAPPSAAPPLSGKPPPEIQTPEMVRASQEPQAITNMRAQYDANLARIAQLQSSGVNSQVSLAAIADLQDKNEKLALNFPEVLQAKHLADTGQQMTPNGVMPLPNAPQSAAQFPVAVKAGEAPYTVQEARTAGATLIPTQAVLDSFHPPAPGQATQRGMDTGGITPSPASGAASPPTSGAGATAPPAQGYLPPGLRGAPFVPGAADVGFKTLSELDAKDIVASRESAIKSQSDLATTALIRDLMPSVTTGWTGPAKMQAVNVLSSVPGIDKAALQDFVGTNLADSQVMNKKFLELASTAVRGMGAREPGSVISLFQNAYPSLGTDPQAIRLQLNALDMDRRYQGALSDAKAGYYNDSLAQHVSNPLAYRGLTGFQKQFNEQNDPQLYMHAAEAMSVDPAAAQNPAGYKPSTAEAAAWKSASPDQQTAIYNLIPKGRMYYAPDGHIRIKN